LNPAHGAVYSSYGSYTCAISAFLHLSCEFESCSWCCVLLIW